MQLKDAPTRKKGLTLIEVGVLAALVMVVGMLVQTPWPPEWYWEYRAAVGVSRMRQLGEATRLNVAGNDDTFPYAGRNGHHANVLDVWTGLRPFVAGSDVFPCLWKLLRISGGFIPHGTSRNYFGKMRPNLRKRSGGIAICQESSGDVSNPVLEPGERSPIVAR